MWHTLNVAYMWHTYHVAYMWHTCGIRTMWHTCGIRTMWHTCSVCILRTMFFIHVCMRVIYTNKNKKSVVCMYVRMHVCTRYLCDSPLKKNRGFSLKKKRYSHSFSRYFYTELIRKCHIFSAKNYFSFFSSKNKLCEILSLFLPKKVNCAV